MTATQTLAVSAIEHGTVIDHLPTGSALRIIRLLNLDGPEHPLSVGLNLPSPSLGRKDLIKVSDWELSQEMANQVAIFAPLATISIIRNYEIQEKYQTDLPESIEGLASCPNPKCITHYEPAPTVFRVEKVHPRIFLKCRYCRKRFSREELNPGAPC